MKEEKERKDYLPCTGALLAIPPWSPDCGYGVLGEGGEDGDESDGEMDGSWGRRMPLLAPSFAHPIFSSSRFPFFVSDSVTPRVMESVWSPLSVRFRRPSRRLWGDVMWLRVQLPWDNGSIAQGCPCLVSSFFLLPPCMTNVSKAKARQYRNGLICVAIYPELVKKKAKETWWNTYPRGLIPPVAIWRRCMPS